MAANADRVAIVQPLVAAGARAPHQEDALAVAQHDVWDDLLPAWVVFRVAPTAVCAVLLDCGRDRRVSQRPNATPIEAARDNVTRQAQDELVVS